MLGATYKTKKQLKASNGQELRYVETSMFGPEYQGDGYYAVVGPSPYNRKWYAEVWITDGVISKVK